MESGGGERSHGKAPYILKRERKYIRQNKSLTRGSCPAACPRRGAARKTGPTQAARQAPNKKHTAEGRGRWSRGVKQAFLRAVLGKLRGGLATGRDQNCCRGELAGYSQPKIVSFWCRETKPESRVARNGVLCRGWGGDLPRPSPQPLS